MMSTWQPANMPSLAGKRVLITGANSGIGFHTASLLAQKGAYILFAARDERRGLEAVAKLRKQNPRAQVELCVFDLGSLSSIRAFTESQAVRNRPLHILINNAGVLAPRRRTETTDGFELQLGVNVLGHFALTALLFAELQLAAKTSPDRPRVVTLSSIAHKGGMIYFDDLHSAQSYSAMEAYRQSKLADLMFAIQLDHRLRAAGSPIMSLASHPGVAYTNLFIAGDYLFPEKLVRHLFSGLIGLLLNSAYAGAMPNLFAATSPEAESGGYYGPQQFFETCGKSVGAATVASRARHGSDQARLWQACEDLTGITFNP